MALPEQSISNPDRSLLPNPTLTDQLRQGFISYFGGLGYEMRPNGYPITETVDINTLTFVNCSMAPKISLLEAQRNNPDFTIHEASIQSSIRLNSLGEDNLLQNPNWLTSFAMAGVITNKSTFAEMTQQTMTYLTDTVKLQPEFIHFVVNPNDKENLTGLLTAHIPEDHIHYQENNTGILVSWDYGIPGFEGKGITICYVTDNTQIVQGVPKSDSQFWNIITIDTFNNNGKKERLNHPFLDVGFGVERLASLTQECTPFDLAERQSIRDAIVKAGKTKLHEDPLIDKRILTLTDHIYTTRLLFDQGIHPTRRDATKRGHLHRNLIRNAILQSTLLHIDPNIISAYIPSHREEISREIFNFQQKTGILEQHLQDIRETWLRTRTNQINKKRPRFSNTEMSNGFKSYVKDRYGVPFEITDMLLKKYDRESFYLSGFHERYYPYPTEDVEQQVAEENVFGISAFLQMLQAKTIIDMGSGKGRHSIALAKNGFTVTALDFDAKSIKRLKEKIAGTSIENVVIPITSDGFHMGEVIQKESKDAVVIFYTSVLAYGEREEDRQTLEQIYTSLKPDGTFLWSVTNLDGIRKYWRAGDAQFYINNAQEKIVYTEKRDDINKTNGRINAHVTAYRVGTPTKYTGTIDDAHKHVFDTYRFCVIESADRRDIIFIDDANDEQLTIAQIISWEEALLSIKPYTQNEMYSMLNEIGFSDIEFRKGIKKDTFNQPSDGEEFDAVVIARK